MLTDAELDQVSVILVRARNPANIGAVARAMHDFGFRRLCVVNEFAVPFEAARSAVDASAVLAGAKSCASLAEAVADCTLVIGTTAIGERAMEHRVLPLAQAAPEIAAALRPGEDHPEGRVALLFGSEKTGLSNEELSHCQWLLTIPMQEHPGLRHASMNLGQAVAVCLYELVRRVEPPETVSIQSPQPPFRAATSAELDRLTSLLLEVLAATGYAEHHPANSNEAPVRRLVRRMGADSKDAQAWMGVLRQVLWKMNGGVRRP